MLINVAPEMCVSHRFDDVVFDDGDSEVEHGSRSPSIEKWGGGSRGGNGKSVFLPSPHDVFYQWEQGAEFAVLSATRIHGFC